MKGINLCFGLNFTNEGAEICDNISDIYLKKYKKIFSFLCSHPTLKMTLFIPGIVLEWLRKNHPEVISILSERTALGQIELLGGGYYEPVLPLILPADRVAQIESLTTLIRKLVGKKPRGVFLNESIWDPSLISSFNTCAMEYTFLDSRIIPQRQLHPQSVFTPHIVEDLGRTVTVIPLHQNCKPHLKQSPTEYLKFLSDLQKTQTSSVVSAFYSVDSFFELIESDWFDNFIALIKDDATVNFNTSYDFLKTNMDRHKSYIPAGCSSDIAVWTVEPCVAHAGTLTQAIYPTVRDFLAVYPEALALYSRMMYTSSLVSQCRGDKARKKAARECLFEAQNHSAYVYTGQGGIRDKNLLFHAYKSLLNAEKLIREADKFNENSSSFDFNHDGAKEYLCFFNTYNAFISQRGGMLFELDIMESAINYCLASKRIHKLDKVADIYPKKMFVDHLLSKQDFNKLSSGRVAQNASFATIEYNEVSFNRAKSSIRLVANSLWGENSIPVTLKKNYSLSENGILVQYIIKNEGTQNLKAKFAVENNVSFTSAKNELLKAEVVSSDSRDEPNTENFCMYKDGVSSVRLEDVDVNTGFVFELNEECAFSMEPYYTYRMGQANSFEGQYEAHTGIFYWDIDLSPGYETEKTISFTIKVGKKKAVAKKAKK